MGKQISWQSMKKSNEFKMCLDCQTKTLGACQAQISLAHKSMSTVMSQIIPKDLQKILDTNWVGKTEGETKWECWQD